MKKSKRFIAIISSIIMLFSIFGGLTQAFAATTYYAYSIGVNHGSATSSSSLTGDFRPNVKYANTCYGMINGITSYYNCSPDRAYMKGNNPSGNPRIASRVVFLNGHANQSNIVFNANNAGGNYDTGVTLGSTTTKCIGLASISMSTCDLISFVGCDTAKETTTSTNNIAKQARSRGATSSVGFKDKITSRSTDGKGWCNKYNDALALGYTISGAISYATSFYPNSDLGKYARVYGSTSNKIATSSGNVSSVTPVQMCYRVIEPKNISVVSSIKDTNAFNINTDVIASEIKKTAQSFDLSDYTVYTNMFSEDERTGIVVFTYMINNKVETNYAYVAEIQDGKLVNIICSFDKDANTMTKNARNTIVNKVSTHKTEKKLRSPEKLNNNLQGKISASNESYYFDFNTNELRYVNVQYYTAINAENVTVDIPYEEVIS